jgi:hypothetical protein
MRILQNFKCVPPAVRGYMLLLGALVTSVTMFELHGICPANESRAMIGRGEAYRRLYRTTADTRPQTQANLRALVSSHLTDRIDAADRVSQRHAEVSTQLIASLKQLTKSPDREALGPFHVSVVLAGRLRINEAVPLLVPLLDFELDSETLPVGIFAAMHFPVAQTLVEIGGRPVLDSVLQDLSRRIPKERLILDAWILQELLGRESARAVLDAAAAGVGDAHRANLHIASQILAAAPITIQGLTSEQLRARYSRFFDGRDLL